MSTELCIIEECSLHRFLNFKLLKISAFIQDFIKQKLNILINDCSITDRKLVANTQNYSQPLSNFGCGIFEL